MGYLETLRRDGWLADPSDQVRVMVIHAEGCPAHRGGPCWCEPRLVLVADLPRQEAGHVDSDLPMLDAVSNE
jgi:hypothetical protein